VYKRTVYRGYIAPVGQKSGCLALDVSLPLLTLGTFTEGLRRLWPGPEAKRRLESQSEVSGATTRSCWLHYSIYVGNLVLGSRVSISLNCPHGFGLYFCVLIRVGAQRLGRQGL
jgi:hypothetical protein